MQNPKDSGWSPKTNRMRDAGFEEEEFGRSRHNSSRASCGTQISPSCRGRSIRECVTMSEAASSFRRPPQDTSGLINASCQKSHCSTLLRFHHVDITVTRMTA